MANLLGQDIGLNYKGIITIGSTINQNVSASLQSLTDGDGNLLPIQVSTTNVGLDYGVGIGGVPTNDGLKVYGQAGKTAMSLVGTAATMYIDLNGTGINFFDSIETRFRNAAGTNIAMNVWGNLGKVAIGGLASNYTPSAVLQVRGNGTDLIFRAENSAGTAGLLVNNDLSITTGGAITVASDITGGFGSYTLGFSNPYVRAIIASSSAYGGFLVANNGNITRTTGESSTMAIAGLFAAAAGSANYKPLNIVYTINNSGAQTGTVTGILLNATETALNGMTHNLMDLQVGGVSRLRYRTEGNSGGLLLAGTGGFSGTYNNPALQFGDASSGFNLDANRLFLKVNNTFVLNITTANAQFGQNLFVGSTTAGAAARLHVRGDGINPVARFETWDASQYVTINAAGTSIAMGTSATNQATIVQGGGQIQIVANTANTYRITLTASEYIYLTGGAIVLSNSANIQSYAAVTFNTIGGSQNITTGIFNKFLLNEAFAPSSGTGVYNSINISNTINQTGGANGVTRGIFVNPTLTSAVDYRAIGVQAGSTSAHKLIRLANAAGNKVFEVTAAQEIGLFGVSPSAQPTTAIAQASVTHGGGSPILEDDLFAGYTVAQIAQALINLGILKP